MNETYFHGITSVINDNRSGSGKSSITAGQFSVGCQLSMIVIERVKEQPFSRDYCLFVLPDIPRRDIVDRAPETARFRGLLNAS